MEIKRGDAVEAIGVHP